MKYVVTKSREVVAYADRLSPTDEKRGHLLVVATNAPSEANDYGGIPHKIGSTIPKGDIFSRDRCFAADINTSGIATQELFDG